MADQKDRVRGATIRHAIARLSVTDLLALSDDLKAARDPFNQCSGSDASIAPALRSFYESAQLALYAAFGVSGGGNGMGKPHSRDKKSGTPMPSPAPKAQPSGVTFTRLADAKATATAPDDSWLTERISPERPRGTLA